MSKYYSQIFFLTLILFLNSHSLYAKFTLGQNSQDQMEFLFKKNFNWEKDQPEIMQLRQLVLKQGPSCVPILLNVMKQDTFPEKNRWMATFLLGQVMGKKASPLLVSYLQHPLWMLRLASLKTLLALKEKNYPLSHSKALKDKSLLVRMQALENIQKLKLKTLSSHVWSMFFNPINYHSHQGITLRMPILSQAIRVLGDLQYEKVAPYLLKMIQKKEYDNLVYDIDYGLSKIYHISSVNAGKESKKEFWKKHQSKL